MATMAPARILGPVLIGAALDRWGYPAANAFSVVFAVASAAVLTGTRRAVPPS